MSGKFKFELKGRSPILFHADDVEKADALKDWREDPENKKTRKPGDDRSPAWTWMTYLYIDPQADRIAIPSDNIMVALRHGATQITMARQKSFKAASQSGLLIFQEMCNFEGPKGPVKFSALQMFQDRPFKDHAEAVREFGFSLFVKRASVDKKKHVRVRARFDEWRCSGTIEVLDPVITDEVLRQMFTLAGQYAGLCDWRPSSPKCPGRYGLFEVSLKKI
jgi:hypothetical protein